MTTSSLALYCPYRTFSTMTLGTLATPMLTALQEDFSQLL